ncbi:hypothetical protein DB30_07490 [Enhygromyxa salina]|uniref:Uncharacterized protein n=1 Tax=Enhygromyxa salina TaxID=215803 RepID=A0A0C2CW31_9BACT|nr:hypothetical protein [Enhygromyxa salina]KIG13835.1 hypothetical protein DB30_07490 [Enhygromyxa salina]
MEEPYEPNWLFQGQWIDIDGRDRTADETCGGTFAYVDAYAGALAVEFGVTEHLGPYRWYSPEQYAADLPCGDDITACFVPDEQCIHSPVLPHTHEVVHMAEFATVNCPGVLSEGLAVFYSSAFGRDAKTSSFDRLVAIMETPTEPHEYGMLGRFMAYLVEHFGVEAVLDVCRITGRYPDGPALSAALESVLGMTTKELLANFEPELGPSCNHSRDYQSRVFACGAAQAAPDLGLVSVDGEHAIDVTFTLDCANDIMVGPLGNKMWLTRRFNIDADDTYFASMWGEDGVEIPELELTLAKCEPCGKSRTLLGPFIGPEELTAGRYSLQVHAPADFRGSVNVTIEH